MTRFAEMMKGWFVFAAGIGAVPLTLVFEAVSGFRTPGMLVAGELFRSTDPGAVYIVPGMMVMLGIDYVSCFAMIFGACHLVAKIWRDGRGSRGKG
jgi:hypothetical protein